MGEGRIGGQDLNKIFCLYNFSNIVDNRKRYTKINKGKGK